MKKISVVTSGGDAPGMNAAIRAVVRSASNAGWKVFGIRRGWWGLIENDFIPLEKHSVSGIIHLGGTILKTLRCPLSRTEAGMKKIISTLEKISPDGLVVIGGDGSMAAAWEISKRCSVPVAGIPASIDNDIMGTDETIGFDTAANTALSAIDKIRDTASSHERVFIVEVMGRHRGFLAMTVGLACGAEIILIPEVKWSPQEVLLRLKKMEKGKKSLIIIMAEGAGDCDKLAKFLCGKSSLEVRVSRLGYVQRGGSPSVDSRILAGVFGYNAIKLLKEGKKNFMCSWTSDRFTTVPLSFVHRGKKKLNRTFLKIAQTLT